MRLRSLVVLCAGLALVVGVSAAAAAPAAAAVGASSTAVKSIDSATPSATAKTSPTTALVVPLRRQANVPPVAVDDQYAAMDDQTAVPLDVRANDSDPGDSLLITAIGGSPEGTPTITGGGTGISYNADVAGDCDFTDSFTYTITDSQGATATANVLVRVWCGVDYAALCIPLTLTSATVNAGDTITAAATATDGGATITVLLDGTTVLATTTSDPSSKFWTTPATIPAGTAPGNHTISARQAISFTQREGCGYEGNAKPSGT